jgi:hypothetical protein
MARSANPESLRVMLATSVLLSGTIWPRWPYEVLRHALQGDYRLVLAPLLIDKATRKFQEKFPRHLPAFARFLQDCDYELCADPNRAEVLAQRDLMRDISDVPIALAAIGARVGCLVSEDKDFTASTAQTRKLHRQLQVLLSGTFLRKRMSWTGEALEAVRGRTWPELRPGPADNR